jgi:hypothetical protein
MISGQPIVIVVINAGAALPTGISDTFTTHYTWTQPVAIANGSFDSVSIYFGTGGAGTSGAVTVTVSGLVGGGAFPLQNALGVLDAHGLATGTSATPSLTLTSTVPDELAIYAMSQWAANEPQSGFPAPPWTNFIMTGLSGSSIYNWAVISTQQTGAAGAQLANWLLSGSVAWSVGGVIVR